MAVSEQIMDEQQNDSIRKIDPEQVEVVGVSAHSSTQGSQDFKNVFKSIKVSQVSGLPGFFLGVLTIPFILIFLIFFGIFMLMMLLLGRKANKNIWIFKR